MNMSYAENHLPMKLMLQSLLLATALGSSIPSVAATVSGPGDYELVLTTRSGAQAYTLPLDEVASVTFSESSPAVMTIKSVSGGGFTSALSEVGRIVFRLSDATGIADVRAGAADVSMVREGLAVYVTPMARVPVPLSLYAADGRLLHRTKADGRTVLDLAPLPPGVYLVKAGSATLKVSR